MLAYAGQYRIEFSLTVVVQSRSLPVLCFKTDTLFRTFQEKGRILGDHLFIAGSKTLLLARCIVRRADESDNLRQCEQTVDIVIMAQEIGRKSVLLASRRYLVEMVCSFSTNV